MNQILYTGGKNKKGGMTDIQKIVIFFVVIIIIFGICLIGLGTNLLSKVKNEDGTLGQTGTTNTTPDEPGTPTEPNIEIKFESQLGGVKIIVNSETKIQKISYWWDEESSTTLEPNDTKYETVIPSRQGIHTLNIEITDENGYIKKATQSVIGDSEPELEITTDRVSNYVIRAKDDEKVEKIVIELNGEKKEIEVNDKEYEHLEPIPQGDSIISVTVYNLNGISVNKKAKIKNFGG